MKSIFKIGLLTLALLVALPVARGAATQTNTEKLAWNHARDSVDADVRDLSLGPLLERVALETGWQVYVEPNTSFRASAKFKALPSGEALRRLLGDLNFALVPQSNAPPRLYVFRTVRDNATQRVRVTATQPRRVPKELIIRVRPGTDIEELARQLGAKVVGHIPELNAYRLQFEDEDATEAARKQLLANSDVTGVSDNYFVDAPHSPQTVTGMSAPDNKLTLAPPKAEDCKVVIGLVDTSLQSLPPSLEAFVKDRVSVVGELQVDDSSPTHATAMFNAIYQAMQSAGLAESPVPTISVNVFERGSANTFNAAAGMIAAANRGATIINTSFGGYGDSPLLRDTVKRLTSLNIPVIAAVGNDASSASFFPAAYPEVVSVTAVERGKIASYANVGTRPDAAAPGGVLFSHNGVTYVAHGTSVSSAAAAGIAAAMAGSNCQPWSQVISTLEKNLPVPGATSK